MSETQAPTPGVEAAAVPNPYEALRKKHGPLVVATVSDPRSEEPLEIDFVFRKPNIHEVSAATQMQITDRVGGSQLLAKCCLVEGPEELLDDVDTLMNLIPVVQSLISELRVRVKKL